MPDDDMNDCAVSAVIPNYNGIAYLKKLLDSIYDQTMPFAEIIIVDDASDDQSAFFIKNHYPEVILLENKTNQGFSVSANKGIRAASSRYVCLLNNDLYLSKTWLKNAVAVLHDTPNAAAAATNIMIDSNSPTVDSQGDDYFIIGCALKRNHLHTPTDTSDTIRRVFSACAAAAIYDKKILNTTGLFDESFGAYYEDVDLAFRINLAGYSIMYTPHAVSYHRLSASYGKKNRERLFYSYRNEAIVFWSNMPVSLLLRYALLRFIFVILQSVVKLFSGQFPVYLKAKSAVFLQISHIIRKRLQCRQLRVCSTTGLRELLRSDWITVFITRRNHRLSGPRGR